jgi:hypothetical protein
LLLQVSTKRINDFLELPESNNVREEDIDDLEKSTDAFNDAFIDNTPEDNTIDVVKEEPDGDQFSDDESFEMPGKYEYEVRFRNAAFSWGMKNDMLLEIDDLDIPTGNFS